MSVNDFRMAVGLRWAARTTPTFAKARGTTLAQKDGLRYEKKVGKELAKHVGAGHFIRLEHNPWFQFEDTYGASQCSPDFLLFGETELTIVEVKLTWVEAAIHKINDLYNPVISTALGRVAMPLLICRNLTKSSPPAVHRLSEALVSPYRLLHWPEIGGITW